MDKDKVKKKLFIATSKELTSKYMQKLTIRIFLKCNSIMVKLTVPDPNFLRSKTALFFLQVTVTRSLWSNGSQLPAVGRIIDGVGVIGDTGTIETSTIDRPSPTINNFKQFKRYRVKLVKLFIEQNDVYF